MHMAVLIEFPIVSFTRRVYNIIFRVSIADFRWMKPEIKLNFFLPSESHSATSNE